MSPDAARTMRGIRWLIVVSWTLYPAPYLAPLLGLTEQVVVGRKIVFTFADVVSKVVYGVLLGSVAEQLSAAQGYRPTIAAKQEPVRDGRSPVYESPDFEPALRAEQREMVEQAHSTT